MKRLGKLTALLLIAVMILCSFSGCMLDEGMEIDSGSNSGPNNQNSTDEQEKGLFDDLIDELLGSGGNDSAYDEDDYDQLNQGSGSTSMMGALFDAFFGGSSSDYGWGESAYSSGSSNAGSSSSFSYADISAIPTGSGKATIMVYIIGSNLESDSACATMDLQEMCKANIGDNVNLIIEAGGAKKWQNNVMNSGKVGRFKVVGEGVAELEDRGRISMVEPSEVLDFINFSVKNYPADRYGFIFWNHGGGTMAGFGMDDLFNGDLSLDEISSVFSKSGIKFDFIGFDACLMGTIETAYALADNAGYLIAAEEEEPGYGWSYTGWLKALTKNPSIDIPTLGSIIVDDFVASNGRSEVTLSVIDLSRIKEVYSKLCNLCSKGNEQLYAGNYKEIAKARKNTKCYGEGRYEQIDIVDFCNKCGLEGANELAAAVKDTVIYHKTNISGTNGLAMYFPYDYPSYYKSISSILKSFGMNDGKATGFFSNFLSARAGGTVKRSMTPISAKTGYKDTRAVLDMSKEEWYNSGLASETSGVAFDLNEDGFLPLTEKDQGYILKLSDDQKDAIAMFDIGVFFDDGTGYVDLGYDNSFGYDDEGNIIIDFDYNWVAINENIVPYYAVEDDYVDEDNWHTYGIVKAILTSARTGEKRNIDILVYWDAQNPNGYVKGYRNSSNEEGPVQAERNVVSFVKGDKIQYLCDFYSYEGKLDKQWLLGDEQTVDSELKVSYEAIDGLSVDTFGHIRDIYGNDYYTETITVNRN